MNFPWTNAGMPAITIPAGTVDGMPVGLQLSSAPGTDELLVAWAAEIQSAIA
jgi:Asp-tRNA(Asn)/Glu-tRNA(Gln) amidotransferase A subunit family amidase